MLRNSEVQRLFDGYFYDRTTRKITKQYFSNTDSTETDERQQQNITNPLSNIRLKKR